MTYPIYIKNYGTYFMILSHEEFIQVTPRTNGDEVDLGTITHLNVEATVTNAIEEGEPISASVFNAAYDRVESELRQIARHHFTKTKAA